MELEDGFDGYLVDEAIDALVFIMQSTPDFPRALT